MQRGSALLALGILSVCLVAPAVAQSNGPAIAPSGRISVAPEFRTYEMMLATPPGAGPRTKSPESRVPTPLMSLDEFRALKKSLNDAKRSAVARRKPTPAQEPSIYGPPTVVKTNFSGVNSVTAGGWRPPDTHGSVGNRQYIQVTNSHIDIYDKTTGVLEISLPLSSFFGYTEQSIFDPRALFDDHWNKWIVTAEAFKEADGDQKFLIAVSKSRGNALRGWNVYHINVSPFFSDLTSNRFLDFPQVGMDQDGLLFTANIFDTSFQYAWLMVGNKAQPYRGRNWTFHYWKGLDGTLTPSESNPGERDPNTYLLANSSFSNFRKYTLTNTSRTGTGAPVLSGPVDIPLPSGWSIPPDAPQSGTTDTLDTLDGRLHSLVQRGGELWAMQTEDLGGTWATPRWYRLDAVANTQLETGQFWFSDVSDDFNASLAVNAAGDMFVTWTSTVDGATNAQVNVSGKRLADANIVAPAGAASVMVTSGTYYNGGGGADTNERWGDYSNCSIDPKDLDSAWCQNEWILSTSSWGTRIVHMGY